MWEIGLYSYEREVRLLNYQCPKAILHLSAFVAEKDILSMMALFYYFSYFLFHPKIILHKVIYFSFSHTHRHRQTYIHTHIYHRDTEIYTYMHTHTDTQI